MKKGIMFNNTVYLNRDQDVDRRTNTETQLIHHGITPVRFGALNEDLQKYVVEPLNTVNLSFGQASCLISHLEIIRRYGDQELIVFEDDIDLSTADYWGDSLKNILSCVDESIGIVQLYAFPTFDPILPKWWKPSIFGTGAYFIKPWYAKKLVETGYRDGKWEIKLFPSKYVQHVADSVLYSSTPTVSLTLFSSFPVVSTILPHATYAQESATFGKSWKEGKNNIEDVKEALKTFKTTK